jgi:hypothetical protein
MNIELEEVVVLDVSDEALEQAAGGAQGGPCGVSGRLFMKQRAPTVSYC